MKNGYSEWYKEFSEFSEAFDDDEVYSALDSLLRSSHNTFAFNKKIMEKAIDVSWVEAIENGLVHVDNFLRAPRKTIEDVEEVVPIALSRKITVDSVKHLAQHTDLIQSIDKKTGKITPSKILNIHKEESMFTYENKFVNTLIDRLFIFINTRYEKLAQVARDEEVFSLGYDTSIDDGNGGRMKVELKIETVDSLDTYDDNGYTVWQRVEKLKKAIEGYKGSELCTTLGATYIRPPVMRTNAIMKNVDLKACLTLWQYIESYDKVGYEINVQNSAVKPQREYIEDFYKMVVLNLLLFRSYMNNDSEKKLEVLKEHKGKKIAPKFEKKFSKELAADYSVTSEAVAGYIAADGEFRLEKKLPPDLNLMFEQINEVIEIETEYIKELEKRRKEEERLRIEAEARRLEQERIEEERKAELERQRIAKEEEEKRLQEMLAKKRAEQEAEERERQRLEEERQARLEEQRRLEEEERLKREEEERAAAERERIEQNRQLARHELGGAEGIADEELNRAPDEAELEKQAYESVTDEELEAAKEAMEANGETETELEDPRAVAARMKLEQQKREKERAEAERAQRLKAERLHFESKHFRDIYREYSWNPIYVLMRLIRHLLATVFGIIPEDTDNPLYKQLLAEKKAGKEQKEREKQERTEMEVYYRKYAKVAKYQLRRFISDWKFKRKKRKADKSKPRPAYTPPVRTAEETAAIQAEMNRLYKEYHVGTAEKLMRAWQERRQEKRELEESIRANAEKVKEIQAQQAEAAESSEEDSDNTNRIANIIATVLVVLALGFVIYVMVFSAQGKAVDIFGHSILRVVTGSMEPSLHVGDFIIIEKTDPEELTNGDIISFYSEQSDIYGMLVTHRIVGKSDDGRFITRGDANPVDDSITVAPDKIVGRFKRKAQFFIWVNSFTDSRKILLLLVMIPTTLIALYELKTVMKLGRKLSEDHEQEEKERRESAVREAIEKEKRRLEEIGYTEDENDADKSGIVDEKEND
ncbi:signal peptidase I [Ruminococcus sp. YRD2003]|uniref:signal peptidase I n=1 Tax=Ruminococcus sp. YRD2003 TaxID=1452313 RepID=UPI0008B19182|nr:signal peptidase I [Ruminococcus flavefaciens]